MLRAAAWSASRSRAPAGAATPFATLTTPLVSPLSTAAVGLAADDLLFDKLMVANRGEIACRIFKTCEKMGIGTVAVYSEADAHERHVRMADEAVCIGPPPSNQSYLVMENLLEAIKMTGTQAVHPGYGFLSERESFAKMLEDNGVTFVGPPSHAVHDMGDKIISKAIALEAGVSCVPGTAGVIDTFEEAIEAAIGIGFPVMIKAAAGGGGKGMRVVHNEKEMKEAFEFASSEALSSFSDGRVMIEKLIHKAPRHVEIQVLGDSHGNYVYLNERECSIQRRNQKVIEEAPSVVLDEETRRRMGEEACALARAVGYTSAGTVEFLVDADLNHYFLEMNTRLQVEHPITEMITGVDIVEEMIRVAAGLPLSITQDDVGIHGHAFESRVYAEDPYRNNLPSIGRLTHYVEPFEEHEWTRCDSGVEEGSAISMHYDPLICKLVTHGKDRDEALARMRAALDEYIIRGVGHNIPLLADVLSHKRFKDGDLSINYLPEEYPDGFHGHPLTEREGGAWNEAQELAALAAVVHQSIRRNTENLPSEKLAGDLVVDVAGEKHTVTVKPSSDDTFSVSFGNDLNVTVDLSVPRAYKRFPLIRAKIEGNSDVSEPRIHILENQGAGRYNLQYMGTPYNVSVATPQNAKLASYMHEKVAPDMSGFIVTDMPGMVKHLNVKVGDRVEAGQTAVVLESMKMEVPLSLQKGGVIKSISVKEGDSVMDHQILLELEDEE